MSPTSLMALNDHSIEASKFPDVEKGNTLVSSPNLENDSRAPQPLERNTRLKQYVQNFELQLEAYKLEARGIQRVEEDERDKATSFGYTRVALFWFSVNLAANNITLGMLGPAVFGLGFLDASLCAVLGAIVGNLPVCYTAIFGPRSGNRTLIVARYAMGWYPAKLVVLLNIIVLLGYSLLDCVIAGQVLSAVSTDGSLSVVVGIIIVAIITLVVTTFGYHAFHFYERYAWVLQLIVLSILAGVAGPNFDTGSKSQGDAKTVIGSRLSFFSLCLSAAITYAGIAADFFVYYPTTTRGWKIFSTTMVGLELSFTFAFLLGIGLASSLPTNPAWASAYDTSQGALIVEAFRPLGTFGSFCSVVVALGLVANVVPPTYSAGVNFQILGRYCARIPRVVWNGVGVVIYTACALAGRDHLAEIFTNFLALMGYWVSMWIAIMLEEQFLFRRRMASPGNDRGYDWTAWNCREKLPWGVAALIAFLVGWVGAILCMAQVWYIGPIAKLVGEYGADMGNYVGFAWAALVFPPLRWFELKKLGR